jgi:PAS domain S-box-containing protein
MFRFITSSLKIKFSLFIACVLLIVFTLASLFLINQSVNFQKESLIARAENYAQLATKPLGDAYNLYNNSGVFQLNSIFQNTLKLNSTVPRIQIISVDGEVLYDTNYMQSGLSTQTNFSSERVTNPNILKIIDGNLQKDVIDSHNNVMEIISPYSDVYGGRPYSLRYFISYDSINASIMQAVRTTIIITIMLFIITFIAVMFLVNRSILTPLVKLTIFAKAIGHGDFDHPLEIKSGDELERLAIDYRYMASNLKAEKAAITAEKDTLSLVLANIADGIVALDAGFSILVLNNAASKILDLKKEDSIEKPFDELIKFNNKGTRVTIAQLCKQSENKISYFSLNFLAKTGELRKFNIIIAPLMHPAESNIRFIITFYDLTKEEEFEKMKLDFVSMSAHELRTPLTAIRGYLSLLQQSVLSKLSNEETTYLQRSIISSQELFLLIENLLNISNIEQGRLSIHPAPVNLINTITSIVTNLQAPANELKVQLIFEKPELPLPSVIADELRIKEVITNLVTNAINFNRPGGWVRVTLQPKEDRMIISIKDNGIGIAESALPHLFTKFFRVTTPLTMGSKGTGLGLFISKKIVDAHNGKIWVESQPDKETVFSFSLALAEKKS